MIDMDRLTWYYAAAGTLDPYFKVSWWQHELIWAPLVGCDFEPPTSASSDNLERFKQGLERGLTIGAHDSPHAAASDRISPL